MSGSLFDFGLYVFHCAKAQMAAGATPAFYLPKIESHLEARLWNEVFSHAERELGVPHGAFKATVLIETLPAAFEMDEILYELRDHIVGLNCGRWDYIFSFIKRLGKNPAFLTPDRSEMTMGKAFLSAYSALLIKTCHRRGAFAMGGMAAQIPVKGDSNANEEAFAKVRADKEREARAGHDGTWVAHPDLVADRARGLRPADAWAEPAFGQARRRSRDPGRPHRSSQGQAHRRGPAREHPGRRAIYRGLAAGAAAPCRSINLMEDAATAEISRAQVWQWLHLKAKLDDGREATPAMFKDALKGEMERVRGEVGDKAYRRRPFHGGDQALLGHVARRHVRGVPDPPGL